MIIHWTKICSVSAFTLLLTAVQGDLFAQKKGGGTPSPPPPVLYQAVLLGTEAAEILDINNSGVIAGQLTSVTPARACQGVVDAVSGITALVDLNSASSRWIDMQNDTEISGWTARVATGINDDGWMVGSAEDENGYNFRRAFLFLPATDTTASTFYLLPSEFGQDPATMVALDINNWGEVIGRQDRAEGRVLFVWDMLNGIRNLGVPCSGNHASINDQGIIVSDYSLFSTSRLSYRYDLDNNWLDEMPGVSLVRGSLNSFGHMAGERQSKNGTIECVRFTQPAQSDLTVIAPLGVFKEVQAINNAGSVLYYKREIIRNAPVYSLLLYRDGQSQLNVGSISSQPLNYAGNSTVMSESNTVTDPEGTGFGLIAYRPSGNGPAIVLIPRKP
jgi:probable HAF family extracellular repeat protein